jgi:hypothetical protein
MRSICLRVVAVMTVALFAPLWATVALADNQHNTFGGGIGVGNPCNATVVSLSGPVNIVVQTNTEPDQPVVSVHLSFKGEGAASNGDAYKMSYMASSNFDAVASTYDLPVHAVFVGKGKAPNFSAAGTIRVYVDAAGKPVGAFIQSFSSSCTQ